jgi:hypothetical protein
LVLVEVDQEAGRMDERNYGIQTDHPTKAELDQRWIRIVAFGVARGVVVGAVVLLLAYLAVFGLLDAASGPAICEHAPCSVALDR